MLTLFTLIMTFTATGDQVLVSFYSSEAACHRDRVELAALGEDNGFTAACKG